MVAFFFLVRRTLGSSTWGFRVIVPFVDFGLSNGFPFVRMLISVSLDFTAPVGS